MPQGLEVLYLHGNDISDINEVTKLTQLPKLKMLTLHGSPLVQSKNYRFHILSILPILKSLDFSAVTAQDRETSKHFKSMFIDPLVRKQTSPKKKY